MGKIAINKTEIFFLFLLGLIPILWFRSEFIIGSGDAFPFWLDSKVILARDIYLWSSDAMGHAGTLSTYLPYDAIGYLLRSLGLSLGFAQILFQVLFFMISGFSMYYFSSLIYPENKKAPFISATFYMFNFFVLQSRLNLGFVATYAFLPLLLALSNKVTHSIYQKDKTTTNKNIVIFALVLSFSLAFASINLSNIILVLLCLSTVLVYYVLIHRRELKPLLLTVIKIAGIVVPLSLWWIIPIANYYVISPLELNTQISIAGWSWTQNRASFLNLFSLNGYWGWNSTFSPYYDSYLNPFLLVLTYVPFLLAGTALFIKSNKSRLNFYLMFSILFFIFLAKGVHEPLSQLNLFLYNYLPGMTMFREPTSKFTMVLLPFLALLIGYTGDRIVKIRIFKRISQDLSHKIMTVFLVGIFVLAAYPLVISPIETKTDQFQFSAYIPLPEYWVQASEWLNNQTGEFKILVTPIDDYYQMPYSWGYYGADEFIARLVHKPLLLNDYAYAYKTNPNTVEMLLQIRDAIKFNRTDEFTTLLDLLNVRYILQRNDIISEYSGRDITSNAELRNFLKTQSCIVLKESFGEIEIYEYTKCKQYMYIVDQTVLPEVSAKIENSTILEKTWNFKDINSVQEWQEYTPENQWGTIYSISQEGDTLKAELWNSTWGWKTINSPILPAQYGCSYEINFKMKGENSHDTHVKIAEFNENRDYILTNYLSNLNSGTFNWTENRLSFELTNSSTKYFQIQIWHGHETKETLPNRIWIKDVEVCGYQTLLNSSNLNLIFQDATQDPPAQIIRIERINPTKISLTLNATRSFVLAVNEAFDSSWTANVNGERIEPKYLYLTTTGFYINKTGKLEITIEYEPQNLFYICFFAAVAALGLCCAFLGKNRIKALFKGRLLRMPYSSN